MMPHPADAMFPDSSAGHEPDQEGAGAGGDDLYLDRSTWSKSLQEVTILDRE